MKKKSMLQYLPRINEILLRSSKEHGGNIFYRTSKACDDSYIPLKKMTPLQLETFENNLIRCFRTNAWIV